ncbi:L-erythro-3,5-diaminohexanoate dehydrogenase [Nocardioides zeae]|uniref:L-erythro-3,5-diaminohexanoate dehydrogenase n=1 Tax=Nocardioides zeae TaxID=1457234 RepID=A0ACC6IHY2_9ACTN|nr:L-erythro-3,5-diaminohexanoate dehydrogenase [Nocardioides zeae]MDR6176170.1 L-erythro-3,5-diaminohexanoate dehydrogenase [Nocardioides zeae]MDR6210317.1 L-erythro-3,5-diaminohexanoate dehydrogenase [Nocardioides zeae]
MTVPVVQAPVESEVSAGTADPVGVHRVLDRPLVLPQAAHRLDARADLWSDEVRLRVERLNLDAASYRQLREQHTSDGQDGRGVLDVAALRATVLAIVGERGKMQNPVTGSGGMLLGTVEEVGPDSPLGLAVGDRVATLVSLSLTPLTLTDGLERWDGAGEQVPTAGHAILFGRSVVARLPADLPAALALSVLDVCGAPALTRRVVEQHLARHGTPPVVAVVGGAGKSGSLSLAAARESGAGRTIGVVPHAAEQQALEASGLADAVVVADARDPLALRDAVTSGGGPADVTVVCVDVPGCEGGAVLATADGGTVVFFSMATSFTAAALGAEGLAADVTMLIGNGYVPGHAAYALDLVRRHPAARALVEARGGHR